MGIPQALADLFLQPASPWCAAPSVPTFTCAVSTVTALFEVTYEGSFDLPGVARRISNSMRVVYDPRARAAGSRGGFGFPNACEIRIKMASGRVLCMLLFANGKVKLSGAGSSAECAYAAVKLVKALRRDGALTATGYTNLRAVLTKYEIDMRRQLNLAALHTHLVAAGGGAGVNTFRAAYNPSHYNGLQVVPPAGPKLCVFSSGRAFAAAGADTCKEQVEEGVRWLQRHAQLTSRREALDAPVAAGGGGDSPNCGGEPRQRVRDAYPVHVHRR